MKYIECPEEYTGNDLSLFLAGGITGCPDWQKEILNLLQDTPLVIINPRRADFDVNNPSMEQEQIHWEHRHLERAKMISFWFP
jgi:Nucleoside 2-deoxyribosyltransferase like